MVIALINWSEGENDPFSFFNTCLKQMFDQLGRETLFLKLDPTIDHQIEQLRALNIDFAMTWQGLGSSAKRVGSSQTIWDDLQIPLFTLQGDHPCLMPDHHLGSSRFVSHHYGAATFTRYANRYFERARPASLLQMPLFFPDLSHLPIEGDFFVMPKNHDDTEVMRRNFQRADNPVLRNFFNACADMIEEGLRTQPALDHHEIVDQMIFESGMLDELLGQAGDEVVSLVHDFHRVLEKFYRNRLAEIALDELKDVPLRIYGRGWDRFANKNPKHVFRPFDKVTDGDFQFRSKFGIIDVCPAYDSLHDRTFRALSARSSMLTGSSWPLASNFPEAKDNIFYCGLPDDLREKAEKVLHNPQQHRERCAHFAQQYRLYISDHQFLKNFELHALQIRNT